MVKGNWKFNPVTATLFTETLREVQEAYESSPEDGIALIDLMCYILSSSVILNEKEELTDIPSTLSKLGFDKPGDTH